MNMLEIKNLCKTYNDFTLDNLNLTVPGGCIMGLIGENGAGKSTTIKLILDMIKKDSGTITVFGKENTKNFSLTKEDIGVVLDDIGMSQCLTAKNINKIMKSIYKKWDEKMFFDYLSKLSVPTEKKFKEFSRGMKMKLGISIALSHHPKLLILDEATSGLDPVVRDEVTDIFCDFANDENHSILISSHIVSDLEKICDSIAFLHRGKLILCEEKKKLMEKYSIVHCSEEQLSSIPKSSVIGKKETSRSSEIIVLKKDVPPEIKAEPIDIEQLFIIMAKGEN